MLSRAIRGLGQSALIVIGAGYGLLRGLRALGNVNQNSAGLETLQARVDTLDVAVARLADQTEQIQNRLDQVVTKDELAQTLDRVFGPLERGIDTRFEHQTRSVEALQMMIGQTDELLQRVLDGLESMSAEGATENAQSSEQGREWHLSQVSR